MSDYDRIARLIGYLDTHHQQQPSLAELAAHVGLSPTHLHRLFADGTGVTPKAFLRCLTLTDARRRLLAGESVLTTALDSGLTGPGRLHDLCVTLEAASPGEIKAGGAGWTIGWGIAESPLGRCLVAESPRGICHLSFLKSSDPSKDTTSEQPSDLETALEDESASEEETATTVLEDQWPAAEWSRQDRIAERVVAAAFGTPAGPDKGACRFRCLVRGTDFQLRVWRALLQIPPGRLVSYGRIAESIGDRKASRAVGSAVGSNSIAVLIPCHRVIRQTGAVGDYRWGPLRKRWLIARELSRWEESEPFVKSAGWPLG